MSDRKLILPAYTYRAILDRVVDGDTIDVHIDIGFGGWMSKRLRFLGVDTDELRGGTSLTKQRAKEAKQFVIGRLEWADIIVETEMDAEGKYGRLLAYVWYKSGDEYICLNDELVEEGFEKEVEND